MGARTIAAVLAGLALAWAPSAHAADPLVTNLPWLNLLPAQPVSADVQPKPVPNCRPRAGTACIRRLANRLEHQWKWLDKRCDHRAVMALSYLRITQALLEDISRPTPLYFTDKAYMAYVITTFSNRYFRSFQNAARGRPVPEAWQIAYDAYRSADLTAGQDVLLFSNAHVQRDLPYAYAEMGLRTRDGRSRKPDHDGVNEINFVILDPTQDEVARRYDPSFSLIDLKPSPLDEYGSMELVKLWREGAWRNAERLMNARSEAERREVEASIESGAATWARFISGQEFPGYRATRDAYCQSQKNAR